MASIALASATSQPSLWAIPNVFDNGVSEFASGFAFGGMSRLMSFEANKNCFTSIFSVTEQIIGLTRLEKVRTAVDNFVAFPIKVVLLILGSYKTFNTCMVEDPNFNFTPIHFQAASIKPVYDASFYLTTFTTILNLAL